MLARRRLLTLPCFVLLVPVLAQSADNAPSYHDFTGRIEAVHSVRIVPRLTDTLDKVLFKPGTLVEKGELLFDLDPRMYQADVDAATAEQRQAQAKLDQMRAEASQTKKLLDRGATGVDDYIAAVSAAKGAEDAFRAAQAKQQKAQLRLDYTHIRAPIDGRIDRALVSPGDLVSADPLRPTLLTTIVSTDPMYVYFPINEDMLPQLAPHLGTLRVNIGLGHGKDFPLQGTLDYIANRVDPTTETLQARAVFSTKDRDIRPGMQARVRVPLTEQKQGPAPR